MGKQCSTCLYADLCSGFYRFDSECEYWAPADDESEDAMIDQLIEDNRKEYESQWLIYLNDE